MKKQGCMLCDMEKLSHWYDWTEEYIICDCKTCRVPMLVWRDHEFPSKEKQEELMAIARGLFPEGRIDQERRAISDHWHFHIRGGKR